MYFVIITIISAAFGLAWASGEADICNDLHALTCAPGNFDDGTGVVTATTTKDSQVHARFSAIVLEASHSKFKAAMRQPKNSNFLQTILLSSGLSAHPSCDSAGKRQKDPCIDMLAQAASELLLHRSVGEVTGSNRGQLEYKARAIESPLFQQIEGQVLAEVRQKNGQDMIDSKISNEIMPKVKQMIIDRVSSLVEDPKQKEKMISKIRSIQFAGSNCSTRIAGQPSAPTLAGELYPGSLYDPVQNAIYVCSFLSQMNNSSFSLAYQVAHEIAHSIDPCNITQGPPAFKFSYSENISVSQAQEEFPIPGVLSCLRSEQSVNAFRTTKRPGESSTQQTDDSISSDDPMSQQFDGFCFGEQINESFCDWMAVEILPEYIKKHHQQLSKDQIRIGYANVFRGMCEPTYGYGDDYLSYREHPRTEHRVNKILHVHPMVREHMNCPRDTQGRSYCNAGTQHDSSRRTHESSQKMEIIK